jgi:membrane-bound lytic murein transglycosylase MltF
MFRFHRTAVLSPSANLAEAARFAKEISEYTSRKYGLKVECGLQMFGRPSLHWFCDAEDINELTGTLAKFYGDAEYMALVDRMKDHYVPGTLQDMLVRLI